MPQTIKRYVLTQPQVQQYVQMYTGDTSVTVRASGGGAATHMPSKTVMVDIGSPYAAIQAAHEGDHINYSEVSVIRQFRSDAERTIFNALEDARIERKAAVSKPGLRHLHQVEGVDPILPRIYEQPWLFQTLAGMVFLCGGYEFDMRKFKPKARKFLARFQPLVWEVRAARSGTDLVPVVRKVLDLYDESLESEKPEEKTWQKQAPVDGDGPAPQAGGLSMDPTPDREKREAPGQQQTEQADEQSNGQQAVPVRNPLKDTPTRLKREMRKFEQMRKQEALEEGKRISSLSLQPSAATDKSSGPPKEARGEVARFADLDAAFKGNPNPSFSATNGMKDTGSGGTGLSYSGGWLYISDRRRPPYDGTQQQMAIDAWHQSHGAINILSRQLASFIESRGDNGARSGERAGRFDPRRLHMMGTGRFDVYRRPSEPDRLEPLVVLSIDMSGSMRHGAESALRAALITAGALERLSIPVEVHGFSGTQLHIVKGFTDRLTNTRTVTAMGNLLSTGGGTKAGEALAFAWTRAAGRREQRRIVIQITDGKVYANTGEASRIIEKMGGVSIGVGVMASKSMADNYSRYISCASAGDFPLKFTRLLKDLVNDGTLRPA